MEAITFLQETSYGNNSLWNYALALLIFLGCALLGKILAIIAQKKGEKWAAKTKTDIDDHIVKFFVSFSMILGIFGGIYAAKMVLVLPDAANRVFHFIFTAIVIYASTIAVQKTLHILLKNSIGKLLKKNNFGKTILPFFEKLITVGLWIFAVLIFLSNIGFEVSSLLAGLGIGGLAFALAAKDTLGNFLASLSIFVDQPFQVGDNISINGQEGTVKEVGIRSTRLASFQGNTQYVIPNAKIADSVIENVSKRKSIRYDFMLGLVYATPAKKIQKALEIIRNIFETREDVDEGYWANFYEFGDFSLNIKVRMNILLGKDQTFADTLASREEINLEIMKQFEKAGLEFAFPTQTIEVKK